MALIDCPECHAQVSDQAGSCIKCGFPFKALAAQKSRVQTIEQTGKKYKRVTLFSLFGSFVGIIIIIGSHSDSLLSFGFFLIIAGLLIWLVNATLSWWHHG